LLRYEEVSSKETVELRSEAFTETEVNTIFSGLEPYQSIGYKLLTFQGPSLFPSSGSDVMSDPNDWD
jgi:hypothetical protein